jgi:hypothetical protein
MTLRDLWHIIVDTPLRDLLQWLLFISVVCVFASWFLVVGLRVYASFRAALRDERKSRRGDESRGDT